MSDRPLSGQPVTIAASPYTQRWGLAGRRAVVTTVTPAGVFLQFEDGDESGEWWVLDEEIVRRVGDGTKTETGPEQTGLRHT